MKNLLLYERFLLRRNDNIVILNTAQRSEESLLYWKFIPN